MATLTVVTDTDYSGTPLVNIDRIEFVTLADATATFDSSQLGPGEIEPDVVIAGDANMNAIVINLVAGATQPSGFDWEFENWSANDTVRWFGTQGNDSPVGSDAKDIFEGGNGVNDGNDGFQGYFGDDIYFLRNIGDSCSEPVGGGTDLINAFFGMTIPESIENLTLMGTGDFNVSGNISDNIITGNSGNNILNGRHGMDTLNGGDGNDTLDGDTLADIMSGNDGDDLYVLRDGTDQTIEAANEGIDQINTFITRILPDNFEKLRMLGSSNINGSGNALENRLTGNNGNNVLDGKDLDDIMIGGLGNDKYVLRDAGDMIVENSGAGTDQVNTFIYRPLETNLENLLLLGTANITATGNNVVNTITGNTGNNWINGRGGSDDLIGGGGNDSFVFNAALGASNIDDISDFDVASDVFRLENNVFDSLATGVLAAANFRIAPAAADGDDYIIYDSTTGALYYDEDGVGGDTQTQFATIDTGLALTNMDFLVT